MIFFIEYYVSKLWEFYDWVSFNLVVMELFVKFNINVLLEVIFLVLFFFF